jgi:A/G-specific adenine glycosylase
VCENSSVLAMEHDLRKLSNFRRRLLGWFRAHGRKLPWRRSRDPYRVWLAEVMLQQTRISAVVPYYRRFLRRFPSVQALAGAPEEEVLKHWSGLGYYSRARNLHRAAREIVADRQGRFPRALDAALALPGIGRYTAAALLSISYGAPFAVLDGNVARVLARLGARRGDLRAPGRWLRLAEEAGRLMDARAAGDWNQAMMELGETVCTPQSPHCDVCPVSRWCRAFALKITDEIPAPRRKRKPVKIRIAAAVLLDRRGRTLLVKEPGQHDGVLFSRMWQFPAVEVAHDAVGELGRHLEQSLGISAGSLLALPQARHGVTFRNITLLPFLSQVERLPKSSAARALRLDELARLPISSATRKIAEAARGFVAPARPSRASRG